MYISRGATPGDAQDANAPNDVGEEPSDDGQRTIEYDDSVDTPQRVLEFDSSGNEAMYTPVERRIPDEDEDPRTRSQRRVDIRHAEAVIEGETLKRDISESPIKRPVRARTGEYEKGGIPQPPKPVVPRPVPGKRGRNSPDEGGRKAHMPKTPVGRTKASQSEPSGKGAATRSPTAGAAPEPGHICSFYKIDQKQMCQVHHWIMLLQGLHARPLQ